MPTEVEQELIRQVTPKEMKASMFSIDRGKSPGPNGYTSQFFKVAWPIVREDVVSVVLSFFFQNGELLPSFNSTCHAPTRKGQHVAIVTCP